MNMKKAILLFPLLVLLSTWLVNSDSVWKYLFFLRLPILVGLFLLFFPKLAKDWLPAILKNIFVLRDKWQLATVIVSAIGSGTSVILVASTILDNAAARFTLRATIKIPEIWQYGIGILLSLYICIVAIDLSQEKLSKSEIQWGASVGALLSVILLFIISLLRHWLSSNTFLKKIFFDILYLVIKNDSNGYINLQTGELTAGHLTAIAFLIIAGAIYITIGLRFDPKPQSNRPEAPALLYVLLIASMMVIIFGGVTFYLDYFRIPVLILFTVFSALSYLAFDVNHVYQLNPLKNSADKKKVDDKSDNFKQVLTQRLKHQQGENTLVIICASGGGIQAAGWTVEVLAGLQELLGKSFTKAIGLISSVSGGSVGSMYYLDHFNKDGFLEEEKQTQKGITNNSFSAATRDSLDAVGWGFAYLDIWRFIGFPFLIRPKFDRGTAVEIDWQAELKEPRNSKTLASWRKQIFDGEIPIPVFNATLVENGWRFLITPMTFGEVPEKKYIDFNNLYGKLDYDMNVVTAARLSATFPYVSPICRSNLNIKDKNYHVADGGYFDNSGFITAAEWLDAHLNEWLKPENKSENQPHNSLNIKRVLILQINPFPESPPIKKVRGDGGWFMATIGPLLAVFKVRDSVLASRNAQEAEFLAAKWHNKVDIQYFPIFFPSFSDTPQASEVTAFYKNGQYQPPLSWKLTDKEKQAIKDGWTAIKIGETIQNIKQLWHNTWKM
ncbi:patatin-like phospholipase family protein [Nostoc sp. PA-18-2419]|uniref:patatin-like phospholipase family protein n=1 Tax=Nostoc sp. PA-18-2419 TaxID=2575443 RepID=UPI001108A4DA|nr:patatin-like phospholipase family protein [Nostoc sp. PA-18-2419]